MEGTTREIEPQKAIAAGLKTQDEGKTAEPKEKATCPCEGVCKVEWKPAQRLGS